VKSTSVKYQSKMESFCSLAELSSSTSGLSWGEESPAEERENRSKRFCVCVQFLVRFSFCTLLLTDLTLNRLFLVDIAVANIWILFGFVVEMHTRAYVYVLLSVFFPNVCFLIMNGGATSSLVGSDDDDAFWEGDVVFSLLLLSVRFMIHEEELLHDAKTTTMKTSCWSSLVGRGGDRGFGDWL
jgi:hypothetical protein